MSAYRSSTQPQDWQSLGRWLATQGMTLDVAVQPRQFAGGLANLNFHIVVNGAPAVLRRPPHGPLAEGAGDMAREWRVLSRLHPGYPLAPRALAYCEDAAVLGAPFQLIEYRPGIAVRSTLPPGVTTRALTSALLDAMTALHRVDAASLGLGDLGRPSGFLARQVAGWTRRGHSVWVDPPPAFGHVAQWLARQDAGDGPPALLHGDFKFDNILVDPASAAPLAVIDWDMATQGDALFDLAVLLSYWIEPDDPPALHALDQVPSLTPGAQRRADVITDYADRVGRQVPDLGFHLALARFRLAIAWGQLYRLYERGAVGDPGYGGFEALARAILDWTADTLPR